MTRTISCSILLKIETDGFSFKEESPENLNNCSFTERKSEEKTPKTPSLELKTEKNKTKQKTNNIVLSSASCYIYSIYLN